MTTLLKRQIKRTPQDFQTGFLQKRRRKENENETDREQENKEKTHKDNNMKLKPTYPNKKRNNSL